MPVLTQPPSMGDLLKYEDNANYTRETVTLLACCFKGGWCRFT